MKILFCFFTPGLLCTNKMVQGNFSFEKSSLPQLAKEKDYKFVGRIVNHMYSKSGC